MRDDMYAGYFKPIARLVPRARHMIAFAVFSGAMGAILLVVVLILMEKASILSALALSVLNPSSTIFFYQQVSWGGIWGIALLAPVFAKNMLLKGILAGLLASLALLFIFFPLQTSQGIGPGIAGVNVGVQLPLLAIIMNSLWGATASWIYQRMMEP